MSLKFTPVLLEQIKSRASLLDEVRAVVPSMKRKGKFWWGCCPFHSEKTPSFHVREEEGNYHCFGCGAHGDIFTFIMETKGGNFPETVEQIANQVGIELPKFESNPTAEKARNDGLKLLARAQTFYQRNLTGEALNYIKNRGLTTETINTFGIGFAPNSWDETRNALQNEGFSPEILLETGMTIKSDTGKGNYDRFRSRLMFPIHNLKDQTVAFGGRIIGDGEPKYLNSPETPFFNKSYLLYNLNRARGYIKQTNQALLVEGYMDAVALWQAGIKTAVAPMGTAVTPEQIQLLWKYHSAPIVCLDGDSAGRKAAIRLANRILPVLTPGKTLHFMWLPDGEDPDTYVKNQGEEAFNKLLDRHTTLEEVLWQDITSDVDLKSADGRAKVDEAIKTISKEIANDTIRTHYRAVLKDKLWKSRSSDFKKTGGSTQGSKKWVPAQQTSHTPARILLAFACKFPEFIKKFDAEFSEINFEYQEDKAVAKILLQARIENKLATENFSTYLTNLDATNLVEELCTSTGIKTLLAKTPAENIENAFKKQLEEALLYQQKTDRQNALWAEMKEKPSPEAWQKMREMNEVFNKGREKNA